MTSPDSAAAAIAVAVARQVKSLRDERGWSAEALAERLTAAGVRTVRSTVANLENGRRRDITFAELIAYASVFAVPIASLLGEPLDRLTVPVPGEGTAGSATVAELIDWFAGATLPLALHPHATPGADFDRARRPFAAHRRHAELLSRLVDEHVGSGENTEPDDPAVQDLARHRIAMRAMGDATGHVDRWAPPPVPAALALDVEIAERRLAPGIPRTSFPVELEGLR